VVSQRRRADRLATGGSRRHRLRQLWRRNDLCAGCQRRDRTLALRDRQTGGSGSGGSRQHPLRRGVGDGEGNSTRWTPPTAPSGGLSRWGFNAYASPAIVDGTVYIGGKSAYALDAADGTEQWTHEFSYLDSATPAVADGTVYLKHGKRAWALNAADGTEQWSFQPEDSIDTVGTGPLAVLNETVYIGGYDTVYALAADEGAEQWSFEVADSVGSSPAVTTDAVYLGENDGTVYALATSDGTEQWRFEASSWVSSVVVVDGTVYAGTADGAIHALTAE